MINNYVTEIGSLAITHTGEQLCGDNVQVVTLDDDSYVVVLADGLGSGVKANILSILTSKIISTMVANNLSIEQCVKAVAETLPVCQVRGIAYSTFTILKIDNNGYVDIYNYDNPLPFMLRDGKQYPMEITSQIIDGKKIYRARVRAELFDTFVLMSDGVLHAGIGETLNFGWDMPQIIDYMSSLYNRSYTSKTLATLLVSHCNDLYNSRPGDDATCVVVRLRERVPVNLMIGPASNKYDDKTMLELFFSKEGKHIVSGGTTSHIVAEYLQKELEFPLDYIDKEIPPIARIEGVDLVTEGIITINKVLEYSKDTLGSNTKYFDWCYKQDGASQIARLLFEEATDINFYVGCAVNPAHQSEGLPISFTLKMQLIEELSKNLKLMGKKIKVSYF